MKFKLVYIFVLAVFFVSCLSSPSDSGSRRMSSRTLNLVNNAVFEVVIEKPEEDSVIYDRALNWDIVPFAIRNDKYYSIGTAFAISRTELISAFHVINLGIESMVFKDYFIRDSQGRVYEIDKITGGSNEKDFIKFTVKNKTFDQFFRFERNYKIGDPVFSIGNALGEGIVVRNGLVLGTVPEGDSGRWNLLKSSADGNPGNSGGPLVTPNGRVVALVTALRDNILYSVPSEVILDADDSVLPYRVRFRFGHFLLVNELNNIFETSVSLPDTYEGVRNKIRVAYRENYDIAMNALFKEAPEYLTGGNNAHILHSSLSSSFPEVSFIDRNDDNWKLSGLNRRNFNLEHDGRLMHAGVSGYHFYKLKKPSNVSIERANTDPKYIMDLILQNIRTERNLWGNDRYRILSYGEPLSTGRYIDILGRTWITANWLIDFDDTVQIMFILPMPDGPVILSTNQNSAFLLDYEWDLQKICDHIFAAYLASFDDWTEYFKMKEFIPEFLNDIDFNWDDNVRAFTLNCGNIKMDIDSGVFDWTGSSEMFLAPSWYMNKTNLEFGFRKIIFNRDNRGNDYFLVYRNIIPDQRLGSGAMDGWNDMVQRKFPFDGNPTISARENNGSVGIILSENRTGQDTLFSLYFTMENPVNEDNLNRRFNALRQGISVTD
ncbi:MAG: serine protease [Treponema sp.]|nr:serine protease [Treponema sp.]